MASDLTALATTRRWKHLLTDTERRLVESAARGEWLDLRAGDVDQDAVDRADDLDEVRVIRARVLEVLLLGERDDWPVRHFGVRLRGARIDEMLDLRFGTVAASAVFRECAFTEPVFVVGANLKRLDMSGSRFPGLTADAVDVTGDVFLREVTATGEVRLPGATIGGNLECDGGSFTNPDGSALIVDSARVSGGVFLRDGFAATGHVNLVNATIGRQLGCTKGSFTAPDRPDDKDLNGRAFTAQGAVAGDLVLRGATFDGTADWSGASVGMLIDDADAWPDGCWLGDGFAFRDFTGTASTDVGDRLTWLGQQCGKFRPGPYSHLAAVYRRRGDPEAARRVLIERERRRTGTLSWWRRPFHWLWGTLSAYGYRPWRAVLLLVLLIVVSAAVFYRVDADGQMARVGDSPYVTFEPLVYAADLAVPLVDLRQANDHQPRPLWAERWMSATITLGWFLSLAFVAAVTGIFKPDE